MKKKSSFFISYSFYLFCIIFFGMMSTCINAKIKLAIEGLTTKLKNNVWLYISDLDEDIIDNTPYFRTNFENQAKKALRALGYYHPNFKYYFSSNNTKLIVHIDAGDPVTLAKSEINITGEGAQDDIYKKFLADNSPKENVQLDHSEYENFKKNLNNLSINNGYFDSVMTKNQLVVYEATNKAIWKIDYDTGKRHRYGKINFDSESIYHEYLENLVPFKENDNYNADDISQLYKNLTDTNWFKAISITQQAENIDVNKKLPILISATSKKNNNMELGLGYASDNGARYKIGYNIPLINKYGHSNQLELVFTKKEVSIYNGYKIPLIKSPINDFYTLFFNLKNNSINEFNTKYFSFGINRNWKNLNNWQIALGTNVFYDEYSTKEKNNNHYIFLLYPSFTASRLSNFDNGVKILQKYSIDIASQKLLSSINLLKLQIQNTALKQINNQRFIYKLDAGLIINNNFDKVPPSFRFNAGGDRSIRGYEYQSISSTDANGTFQGATQLLTGSFEYQYQFYPSWWSAIFVDSGKASNDILKSNLYTGIGAGLRWDSAVGQIKFDIGFPMKHTKFKPHFYIGFGTAL